MSTPDSEPLMNRIKQSKIEFLPFYLQTYRTVLTARRGSLPAGFSSQA